jgi:hypothetical protein
MIMHILGKEEKLGGGGGWRGGSGERGEGRGERERGEAINNNNIIVRNQCFI